MKKRPFFVLTSICLYFLASCVFISENPNNSVSHPSEGLPTANPVKQANSSISLVKPTLTLTHIQITSTPTFVYPSNATPFPRGEESKTGSRSISPDNNWELSFKETHPITLLSITDKKSYQDPKSCQFDDYIGFESWFPDSSGFILSGLDFRMPKSPSDRLYIYHINSEDILQCQVIEPVSKRNIAFQPDISWSPDGKKFVVVVAYQEIYIYDHDAKLIRKISPKLTDHSIVSSVDWTKIGLFFIVSNREFNPHIRDLRFIDLNSSNNYVSTLFSSTDYPSFISYDPFSPRLLIQRHPQDTKDSDVQLVIFNLQTGQFEDVIQTSPIQIYYKVNEDHSVIAFQINSESDNLHLFYWKTRSVVDKKIHVDGLWDWDPIIHAFIVYKYESSDISWTEAIRP